jgi:hypothetical protein
MCVGNAAPLDDAARSTASSAPAATPLSSRAPAAWAAARATRVPPASASPSARAVSGSATRNTTCELSRDVSVDLPAPPFVVGLSRVGSRSSAGPWVS